MDGFNLRLAASPEGRLRVSLLGEFDLAGVTPFREAVISAIESDSYWDIEFDLEQLTFIDSSGWHALVDADRMMRARGGTAHVVCSAPRLLERFRLVGLDRMLSIVPEPPRARAAA